MKFRVEVICINDGGAEQRCGVMEMERHQLAMETLGLSLTDGKTNSARGTRLRCFAADGRGSQTSANLPELRSVIPQQSNRDAHRPDGVRAGLGTESAVGAGSLIPFEKVSGLLKEVLPVGESTNHETVGEHLQAIAERMEAELGEEREPHVFEGQEEQGEQPLPDGPMTVGIDGGYVRAAHKEGCFEVIAGRSVVAFRRAEEDPVPPAKCFGFVADLRSESEAPPATMGADEIAGDAGKPAGGVHV